jgi:lysosomal Pro-X carboxypeptidase
MDGVRDMFWSMPFNQSFVDTHCRAKYGFAPRPDWIRVSYGDRALKGASNIVFANGLLDPWSSAGVSSSLSDSLIALPIPHGGTRMTFCMRPAHPL